MLSEISQTQKGKYYMISLISKKVKLTEAERRMVVAGGWGDRKVGDVGQRVQSFSY